MIVVTAERRRIAAGVAVLALALAVAAMIEREPADFSALPPLAVVRDTQLHPLWTIRMAAAAHLIAVDAVGAPTAPDGQAYQLWLSGPNGTPSLGLLPAAGRKVIPETPAAVARLSAAQGELNVTLEPARGSVTGQPSGPVMFHAQLAARAARAIARWLLPCQASQEKRGLVPVHAPSGLTVPGTFAGARC